MSRYDVGNRLCALLERESKAETFPAETILWIDVHPRRLDEVQSSIRSSLTERWDEALRRIEGWLTPVLLDDPLQLQLRGSKRAELLPCTNRILGLQSATSEPESVQSLDHAYAHISTLCEPHRVSHTGNVFDKVYFVDQGHHLRRIDDRRIALENDAELALHVLSHGWWLQDAHQLLRRRAHLGQDDSSTWLVSSIDQWSIVRAEYTFDKAEEATAWLKSEGISNL